MIISMKPATLSEVAEQVKDLEEKKSLQDYLKKFSELKAEKAEKLREELSALGNHKMKEEYIVKIVDILPKDLEDVHKIFTEVSLDEKEANEILEIVKRY